MLLLLISGAIAISIANPTDLVKVRLQAEGKLAPGAPRRYAGAMDAYAKIVRQVDLLLLSSHALACSIPTHHCLLHIFIILSSGRVCCFVDWHWTQCCAQCHHQCCRVGQLWSSQAGSVLVSRSDCTINFTVRTRHRKDDTVILALQTILKLPGFKDDVVTHLLSGLGAGFFAVCVGSPVDVVRWPLCSVTIFLCTPRRLPTAVCEFLAIFYYTTNCKHTFPLIVSYVYLLLMKHWWY